MKNMELVEKFKKCIGNINENEDGTFSADGAIYHFFSDDPDLPLLEKKLENLMKLIENENKNGNFDSFMSKEFETDIWPLI
jgi:hypothetical protein